MNVLDLIVPKEKKFFEMLRKQIVLLEKSASLLSKSAHRKVSAQDDFQKLNREVMIQNSLSDKISQEIVASVYETFITPIDRDELQNLTIEIDAIIDSLEKCTTKLMYLKIYKFDRNVVEISNLLTESTQEISHIFESPMKVHLNTVSIKNIRKNTRSIDTIFYRSMKSIFELDDAVQILKQKELLEAFRDISLRIRSATNTFERALINHS